MTARLAALGLALALAQAALAASPSFDCATAKPSSIERLICDSPMLSALEAEEVRVYRLLVHGDMAQKPLPRPVECMAKPAPERCARNFLLERINFLRSAMQGAHRRDPGGISEGPVTFTCDKAEGALNIIFVNGDVRLAYATFRDGVFFFEQVESASGAKYEGAQPDELFWSKGDTARFRAGSKSLELSCKVFPMG